MLHLVHPVFVHFSAALLVAGGVVESLAIFGRRERVERFGAILVLAGAVSLVPTVATGFLAQNVLEVPAEARPLLERHERVGLGILAVFLVSQLWKAWFRGRVPAGQRTLYACVLLLGVALVVYGAFLGGEMVYGFGVGVNAG